MIIIRCTRRAASALGLRLLDDPASGTSPLGDWYVNLVPTSAGGIFLFMNEQSLLAVAVPRGEAMVLQAFVARVANILSMIGIPGDRIEVELEHFVDARAGRTSSKRLLGVMNDLATRFQDAIDVATPGNKISLSDLECKMARMPQATLAYRSAQEVALELLGSTTRFGVM